MSAAAALLDQLGRPGDVRLGTAQPEPIRRLATGLSGLDRTLGGGLPRGRVVELAGQRSTGRTGLACAVAAHATQAGETIAWIDVDDALEPAAVGAAGVVLARLLWVRPRGAADALRAADILLGAGGFGLVVLDAGDGGGRCSTAIWSRLARAAERSGTVLLVAASRRQAGTFAAVGLEMAGRRARWSGGPERLAVLDGLDTRIVVARNRIGRPGQSLVLRQACA